jgi:gas vesicle protein
MREAAGRAMLTASSADGASSTHPLPGGMTMPTLLDRIRRDATEAVTDAADAAASTSHDVAEAIGSGVGAAASTVSEAAGTAGTVIADTTADAAGSLVERVAELADAVRERLGDAAGDASDVGRSTARTAAGRVDDLRSATARTSGDLAATLRDATARVTDGAPLDDVVRRLERRWPGTDTQRYDAAYERGYARGRSGRLAVGLAVGAAAAAAGTWLLDPERGPSRRARLQAQGRRLATTAREQLAARGVPGTSKAGPQKLLTAVASPGAIGEIPSQRASTASTAVSGPSVAPLEPVVAGTVAAEGHDDAARDADRGAWHRDLPTG